MKTYDSPGEALTFTAPAGGVVSGVGVKIGDILVIATDTKAVGERFTGQRTGVVTHAKVSAQAWTEGQRVHWDNAAKLFTTVTTGNFIAGVAVDVAPNPSGSARVLLFGVSLGAALA